MYTRPLHGNSICWLRQREQARKEMGQVARYS